jgi:hypothetical protein
VGRHTPPAATSRPRLARAATLTVVWLAGLAAGLFALLGAAARYTTCSGHSTSLACEGTGTSLGVVLVLGVVTIVTTATVVTHGRDRRQVLVIGAIALLVLAGLLLAARALLATV